MSKHPWLSLTGTLFLGLTGYLLISLVGCGVANTAVDTMEKQEEAERDAEANRMLCSQNLKELHVDLSNSPAEEAKEDAEGFRFPDDRGGQILSKVLPPSEKTLPPAAHDAPAPRRLPPAALERPSLPLPPAPAEMPRLPAGKAHALRPRPLPEDLPLAGHLNDPMTPQTQTLHAGDRIRVPSVDVNQPIPVPILARPISERALLDDATADASYKAALATSPPTRATPAPFLKIDLPDPFEHRLKPVTAPAEDVAPVHTGSRPAH
jgi:hypothetical protein